MKQRIKDSQLVIRAAFFVALDICSITAVQILALWMRYDFRITKIEDKYLNTMWDMLPYSIIIAVACFAIFRLYSSLWVFAGVTELENIFSASILAGIGQVACFKVADANYPRSCFISYVMFLMIITAGTRFSYRFFRRMKRRRTLHYEKTTNVMIIGAGAAGAVLIREMKSSEYLNKKVCCIIDDAPEKKGAFIEGIKVVGGRDEIAAAVEKYNIEEINIAIPSASRKIVRELADVCQKTMCEVKILPGIYQFVNGDVKVSQLRKVEIEDLLGREPINVNIESIMDYVTDKVVMVTGGGGSIGSELCRQIAGYSPKQLIIVDIYENNAYEIQQELIRKYPKLNLVVLIASVRNTNRMDHIFKTYRPEIVYHAAAHKHVPLMEVSPNEAVKNNVFGTLKTVQAADKYGVKRFVLISTDKAVNPTNIMGATKRMCEMIVQTYNNRSRTEFVAVRFGNVLGSNGSVIPLFKKQIAEGGPVTVTHPDIIRYFMTIPEAVSLVLQAGANAKGGEIFVLDMGAPVKIVDLATNLIRLSGFVPGEDIEIKFTGLRPGEKLYEELLMEEEGLQDTENKLIHIGKPIEMDEELFLSQLAELYQMALKEPVDIRLMVQKMVPTYVIKEEDKLILETSKVVRLQEQMAMEEAAATSEEQE